jgi:membrane fusion protein, multidrug efflux system
MYTTSSRFVLCGAFTVLVAGAAACGDAHSSAVAREAPATPVRTMVATQGTVARSIRAIGRVGHKHSWSLAFKNGGTVRALFVQDGAYVKKGQRLALVDETEIAAQVAQARASVDKADRDLQLARRLGATQAASKNDADNAGTQAELAHAALQSALYNQSAAVLLAPQDGRIDKRLVEVGEQVAPGRPIYSMSGGSEGYVVRVGVVDRDLPALRLGDQAKVEIDALPGHDFAAVVSEIATAPTPPAGTYEIELRLTDANAHLASGMTAKVDLQRTAGSPMPIVPLGAIVDADGLDAVVYVLVSSDDGEHGQTVRRTPIRIACVVGDRVAVERGLAGNERVVSEGATFVEPGRIVRAVEVADARR